MHRNHKRFVIGINKGPDVFERCRREGPPLSQPVPSPEFSPDEDVTVGEELDLGDTRISVTAIESKGRRVGAEKAKSIDTVWAKRIDQVRVKFSVNKGNRTVPHEVLAAADEEFEIGEIVDLGRDRAVVHHIRTERRTLRQGRVRADEIVRMYGRGVRERTSR